MLMPTLTRWWFLGVADHQMTSPFSFYDDGIKDSLLFSKGDPEFFALIGV